MRVQDDGDRRLSVPRRLHPALDRLGTLPLPADLGPGDLLAFGMTGAYGATEAMPRFLSHPVPPEIWLD
jgi:diaminopimelate decarboxylase